MLLALAVVTGPGAMAQETAATVPAGAQLLVISQERLITESALGRLILARDEADKKKLSDDGEALSVALETEEKDLTEKRKTMDPVEFRALADAFDEKVRSIRSDQDSKAEALVAAIEGRRRQFFTQIAPLMLAEMQARKASVILDQRSVILATREINVTDAVIVRIDTAFKKLADIGIAE